MTKNNYVLQLNIMLCIKEPHLIYLVIESQLFSSFSYRK